MEDQFVHSASLEVIMGDEAYADLQSRCRFEEVELAERGQEMLWNGKWNWAALSLFIREEIGWLGEGMFVDGTRAAQDGGGRLFEEAGLIIHTKIWANAVRSGYSLLSIWASPNEATHAIQTAAYEHLLQGLTGNETIYSVMLSTGRRIPDHSGRRVPDHSACPFSGPALSRFLTQLSHDIPQLNLLYFEFDEEHCRALVATEIVRDDVNIILSNCYLTEAGERVLCDGIRHNRGSTHLYKCPFNMRPLAEALRGNARKK